MNQEQKDLISEKTLELIKAAEKLKNFILYSALEFIQENDGEDLVDEFKLAASLLGKISSQIDASLHSDPIVMAPENAETILALTSGSAESEVLKLEQMAKESDIRAWINPVLVPPGDQFRQLSIQATLPEGVDFGNKELSDITDKLVEVIDKIRKGDDFPQPLTDTIQ